MVEAEVEAEYEAASAAADACTAGGAGATVAVTTAIAAAAALDADYATPHRQSESMEFRTVGLQIMHTVGYLPFPPSVADIHP